MAQRRSILATAGLLAAAVVGAVLAVEVNRAILSTAPSGGFLVNPSQVGVEWATTPDAATTDPGPPTPAPAATTGGPPGAATTGGAADTDHDHDVLQHVSRQDPAASGSSTTVATSAPATSAPASSAAPVTATTLAGSPAPSVTYERRGDD